MTLKIRKSGSWANPATVKYRSGGSWVTPSAVRRRQGGAWVTVWPVTTPLAVSLDTTEAYGTALPGTNHSDPVTATASGGTGNYTYSWKKVAGGSGISIESPTSRTTTFSHVGTAVTTVVFKCTVSDGVSTVTSSNVTVTFE